MNDYKRQEVVLDFKPDIKKYVLSLKDKKTEKDFDDSFDNLIEKGNIDANRIAWIWNNEENTTKYFNSTKTQYHVLFRLKKYIENKLSGENKLLYLQILDIFVSWTKQLMNVRERFLPWQVLIISLIKKINPKESCKLPSDNELIKYHQLLNKNLDGEKIDIDDYVKDMHTKEGKRLKRGSIHFADVSSVVIPEDKNINYDFKELYTIFKYNVEEKIKDYKKPYDKSEKKRFGKEFVRAQLVCSNAKQDTYFANDNGKVVFVKGPYINRSDIGNIRVKEVIKNFPEINHIDFSVEELIPDLFDKSNLPVLGIRNTLDNLTKPYPFMIMKDIVGFNSVKDIPKKHKDSKCWPMTEVVDFDKVNSDNPKINFVNLELIMSDDNLMKEYILNIMFKYILGIPDLADRNFYVKNNKIFSIDLDSIGKSFNIKGSLRDKKYNIVSDFIKANEKYFESVLLNWKRLNQNSLTSFEETNLDYLIKNLKSGI